jgi:hypothetical protein
MKKHFLFSSGFVLCCGLPAADPTPLTFGGKTIGVPPLLLAEAIADSAATKPIGRAIVGEPSRSPLPNPGLNLLERGPLKPAPTDPTAPTDPAKRSRAPRISRESGMPIITPSEAIDYKMVVIAPNPEIDFKMIIKEPRDTQRLPTAK